jgi:hypothetical protein
MTLILEAARAAYAAGLAPLPVSPDGSKSPDVRRWKDYQTTRPSVVDLRSFAFDQHDGLGIVSGSGSGHRECWDFDTNDVFEAFVSRAQASGLGPLVDRVTGGYLDRTPGGGRRIIVTYPRELAFKDCTLARRPGRAGEPPVKTLIELPSFAIVAPSNGRTHPSGKAYERLHGAFTTIAAYTVDEREALIELARTFDEMPRPEARPSTPSADRAGKRPGDDFNRRTTWPQLLEPHGWTVAYARDGVTYWRRPGKAAGGSATTNYGGSDLLYVFSSSTVFDSDKSYSKFAVYAVLEHRGDYSRAALALFKDGYGVDDEDRVAAEPQASTASTSRPVLRSLRLTPASRVELQAVHWLWDKWLAAGTVALVGGREGIGKSVLVDTLAADLTRGRLPGIFQDTPKGVIICATEDSWSHTITPRLMAANADLDKVYRADIVDAEGFECPLSLPKDTAALTQAVKDVDAAMVILDPLLSRLEARLDSHKDADTRRMLEPLAQMADTARVAVVGLIHVSKSTSLDALSLLMASRAFAAVARSVLFVAVDPENEDQRLLALPKSNLGKANLPMKIFHIRGAKVGTTADDEEVWTGQLQWTGESDRTIRDVLVEQAAKRGGDAAEARNSAEAWLLNYLKKQGGTAASKDVIAAAIKAGHAERTLQRAREHAGIDVADTQTFPSSSYWSLPGTDSCATSHETTGTTGSVGTTGPQPRQLCQDITVAPLPGDGQNRGATGATGTTAPVEPQPCPDTPVVPDAGTSPDRGTTGIPGTTEPQLFEDSITAQRWRTSDERFKQGWQ